ncbi:MAG: phosphatidate cytidylyltransferase [Alphaproteobacteria bacterium]|nr:MAG: phosphatidate cytidylyltransferase [Alphaproteobacteria bacterium]
MSETSISPKKKNGLMLRVVSALVMLPIAIFIILQGGIAYNIFVVMITVLILYEWNGICEDKALNAAFVFQVLTVLLLVYYLILGIDFDISVFLVPFGGLLAACIYYKIKLNFAILGLVYALLPALSLIFLRQNDGGLIVLWMMIIVWSMDIGAYFSGKTIGGPKMSPRISPNKTWAGLIGGAVTAVVFGLIAAHYFNLGFDLMFLIPVVTALAIWSQIGDLAESALKRHFKVKDSGALIPGHGGIMDRVDGVVFAAPAMMLFLYLLGTGN